MQGCFLLGQCLLPASHLPKSFENWSFAWKLWPLQLASWPRCQEFQEQDWMAEVLWIPGAKLPEHPRGSSPDILIKFWLRGKTQTFEHFGSSFEVKFLTPSFRNMSCHHNFSVCFFSWIKIFKPLCLDISDPVNCPEVPSFCSSQPPNSSSIVKPLFETKPASGIMLLIMLLV